MSIATVHAPHCVVATVTEVLPALGLAYLLDESQVSWGITRSTPGSGLGTLEPGQRVELTIELHDDFALATGYAALD